MASIEKLIKSFEALKLVQPSGSTEDQQQPQVIKKKEAILTKKDKIAHCTNISDAICTPSIRTYSDFPKLLGVSIESFFLCCDDDDSAVRMVADECLSRTIKTLLDSHLGRLQAELYKEIKKNGPARSLRVALLKFGDVCHLIKPLKCRPYTVNLLPCLVKISQRTEEEAVQEALAYTMGKVMPVLGQFTNDSDIKMLLKAFLPNLSSSSALIRRTAATSLVTVCQWSRKPKVFYLWLLNDLFDIVLPVQDSHSTASVVGVLVCLRHLIPLLSDKQKIVATSKSKNDASPTLEHFLKVYELLLHYLSNVDHTIVTAALEALNQLLLTPPPSLLEVLLCPSGITESYIHSPNPRSASRSDTSGINSSINTGDEMELVDENEEPHIALSMQSRTPSEHPSENEDNLSGFFEDVPDDTSAASCDGDESEFSSASTAPARILALDSPLRRPSSLKKLDLRDEEDCAWDRASISSSPGFRIEFSLGLVGNYLDSDVPLKYCSRLLSSNFLLTGSSGSLMPDRNIRVSMKVLAITCLTRALTLYPPALFLDLYTSEVPDQDGVQKMWDIVEFVSHCDPQLCGQTAVLIGHYLGYTLKIAGSGWDSWARKQSHRIDVPKLVDLISKLISVTSSPLSVSSRAGLQAIRYCIKSLLHSSHAHHVPSLLDVVLKVKNNSYWLVKVELAELIGELPFRSLQHISGIISSRHKHSACPQMPTYQDILVTEILFDLLGDEDVRVRTAATTALSKAMHHLYHSEDYFSQTPMIAEAEAESQQLLGSVLRDPWSPGPPQVHGLVAPFICKLQHNYSFYTEGNLSRIVERIWRKLISSSNKYVLHGCCQALARLIEDFPSTVYTFAWGTVLGSPVLVSSPLLLRSQNSVSSSNVSPDTPSEITPENGGLLSHLIALMSASPLALDIHTHQCILLTAGHLLSGACYVCMRSKEADAGNVQEGDEKWSAVKDRQLVPLIDKLFLHTMRLLNIFAHTLEEQMTSSRPGLPGLSGGATLSPIRRRNKSREDSGSMTSGTNSLRTSPGKPPSEKESEKPSKSQSGIGHFSSVPLYLKLYDVLKAAHSNYKVSLDSGGTDKFTGLLRASLLCMGQILEIAQLHDVSKNADELLSYLKVSLSVESVYTVQCVRQLLKALFGTNLASLWEGLPANESPVPNAPRSSGLYYNCCSLPYTCLSKLLASYSARPPLLSTDPALLGSWLTWMRQRSDKKLAALLKPGSKGEKAVLAAHIRLFEPMVIQALKQYTMSSNSRLQATVLDLLAQLVQLRVNYCLLDSDQIFIGFVIKQFEFIEEGQIMNAEELIPQIFYFLVLLSYERYHSKPIISMPEIIQLCDRLMASGQPPNKYVIPALQAIVEDLFLLPGQNRTDSRKELDTLREVVVSVLLRLVQYPEVLRLLLPVLHHSYQEGEDRWRKFSRQLIDVLLPLMSRMQVHLDDQEAVDILQKLFDSVAPSVFRPIDILLKALLIYPVDIGNNFKMERWMCLVLMSLRVLIAQTKEEVVLSRLADLGIPLRVPLAVAPDASYNALDVDSLGDNMEKAVARYLLQVVSVHVKYLHKSVHQASHLGQDNIFLCQQMAGLLLYLTHMFQSGSFRRVATAAMEAVHTELAAKTEEISQHFLSLAYMYPTLTVQWCNILTLLNYGEQDFWSRVLWPSSGSLGPGLSPKNLNSSSYSCSFEMVSQGGLILLCDYLCENIHDAEPMTWLIVNHVSEVICLSSEPPVLDFISVIHRNAAASGLFIQAVLSRCDNLSNPSFVSKLLHCLEGIHPAQSNALLALLIEKVLPTSHLALARCCESLAQRQLELLLSEPGLDVSSHLTKTDTEKLIGTMKSSNLSKRHSRLLLLLEKLQSMNGEDTTQESAFLTTPNSFGKQNINKEWFLSQVKERCCLPQAQSEECAQMLSYLNYEDAHTVMILKGFQLRILKACFELGLKQSTATESPLYRATRATVLQHITHLITSLPQPHHPFMAAPTPECPREARHQTRLIDLFTDQPFWEIVAHLAPALCVYLTSLSQLPVPSEVPVDSLEDIARFAILCAEAVRWMLEKPAFFSCDHLKIFIRTLDTVLSNASLASVIGLQKHVTWVCSAVSAIHGLVSKIKGWKVFPVQVTPRKAKDNSPEYLHIQQTCTQIAELVGWLEFRYQVTHLSSYLLAILHRVITGLARLPLVNSFVRTPPILWQMDWKPHISGEWHTLVPPPPADSLLDRDLLQQYIFRINLLGWISRQQFEETWMALLGVLNSSPSSEPESSEDEQERITVQCLSVRCITSLLLQSLLLPQPGNPHSSVLLHQPRDKPLAFPHTRCGKRLHAVRTPIHHALQKFLKLKHETPWGRSNLERLYRPTEYSLGLVSVEYMCIAVGLVEDREENSTTPSSSSSSSSPGSLPSNGVGCLQREQSLAAAGLDLRSCLHFLLDLYTQWLGPPDSIAQPLLTETIRSVVMLSDIFMECSQFDWMLSLFMDMYRHHPSEDEILAQYLILGIAKAAAVVGLDSDMQEKIRKFVETGLQSSMPSTQLLSLHGLLYMLAQGSDPTSPLLPSATDYLNKHLEDQALKENEHHILTVWALAFYVVENYVTEQDLGAKIFQVCLNLCNGSDSQVPLSLYLCIIHGLERLLLADVMDTKENELVLKVCVDRIRHSNSVRALAALGVMLSALYIAQGGEKRLSQPSVEVEPNNREQLITALERVTVLFDRIKRGYPSEAELVCKILPGFLGEFFPAQDILNKVIGEFLSNQQPHPQFLAGVLFKVCEALHEANQEELIQDWVLLSLSNFTQRSPLAMAVWSLSCCFVAATATAWLRALFPLIQSRMGKLEDQDRQLFCVSGIEFRSQLSNDQHKIQFDSTIKGVALNDTPYAELLKKLQVLSS